MLVFSLPAFADMPVARIESGAVVIPASAVNDILRDHPDASAVTKTGWHSGEPSSDRSGISPRRSYRDFTDVKITTTENGATLGTYFLISVAKGATATLSTEFTKTISTSVKLSVGESTTPSSGDLGISSTVTAKVTTSKTFNGPSESSQYNSRAYYVRFYGDRGTWSATAVWSLNPTRRPKVSGTWSKPTHYAEYSVDSTIK